MRPLNDHSRHATAVLALADITAAIESFNRGDANLYDALDAIIVAVEAHRAALQNRRDAA